MTAVININETIDIKENVIDAEMVEDVEDVEDVENVEEDIEDATIIPINESLIINKVLNKFDEIKIHSKQKTLLYSPNGIISFYKNEVNKKILVSTILQKTSISLRLLDWLVTNYSKKFDVHYELGRYDEEYVASNKNFNLWKDYKNQLKSFSKRLIDPFCRRQRIYFNMINYEIIVIDENNDHLYHSDVNGIITTVGQLNFFRWAIQNKVIDYAFDNLEKIESDMLSSADKKSKNKTAGGAKLNKRQLSKNNSCAKSQKIKVIVQFQ